MEPKYSFDEIQRRDNLLFAMSIYELTQGGMADVLIRNEEEHFAFMERVRVKWLEFKSLIRRGETTLEDLGISIGNRWGAVKNEELSIENPEQADRFIQDAISCAEERAERDSFAGVSRLLKAVFSLPGNVGPQGDLMNFSLPPNTKPQVAPQVTPQVGGFVIPEKPSIVSDRQEKNGAEIDKKVYNDTDAKQKRKKRVRKTKKGEKDT